MNKGELIQLHILMYRLKHRKLIGDQKSKKTIQLFQDRKNKGLLDPCLNEFVDLVAKKLPTAEEARWLYHLASLAIEKDSLVESTFPLDLTDGREMVKPDVDLLVKLAPIYYKKKIRDEFTGNISPVQKGAVVKVFLVPPGTQIATWDQYVRFVQERECLWLEDAHIAVCVQHWKMQKFAQRNPGKVLFPSKKNLIFRVREYKRMVIFDTDGGFPMKSLPLTQSGMYRRTHVAALATK
jgi:hypothetical protein